VKPVLTLNEGEVVPLGRGIGTQRALRKLVDAGAKLVVTAHLLGGLTTLALLWWTYLRLAGARGRKPARAGTTRWLWAALSVLTAQIALGGWTSTNYAAWACGTDFPDCHGSLWPQMDFATGFTLWHGLGIDYEFGILDTPARTAIHWSHRLFALVAALVSVLVARWTKNLLLTIVIGMLVYWGWRALV